MKMLNKKFILYIIFMIVFSCFLIVPKVHAASYDIYTAKYKCPVRKEASDKSDTLKSGNDVINIAKEQQVEHLKTVTGPNEGNNNATWYAIKFDYAAREYTGYIAKACMYDVKTYSYSDDTAFENSISSFPDSYKTYLRKLHAMHPNWTFKMDKTNLNWADVSEAESQKGTSAISYLYPSLIFKDSLNPNGIVVDGTSWYAPAKEAVMYFLDARNFINEKNIFMFQSLSYNSSEDSSVQKILDGSFMAGTFLENGVSKTYASAFIEAAKANNISSTYLAALSLQEMGTTKSSAASGTVSGYEGYYNFYNIGATSGADNYLKGLAYAKEHEWNSIQKAITGGASFIASNYINKGQDTIYFKKFNVSSYKSYKAYTHQYQTNIMAPQAESSSIYSSNKADNKLNNNYTFIIPVYNNMPSDAFKVSKTDTVGGSTVVTTTPSNNTTNSNNNQTTTTKVLTPSEKVVNAGYTITGSYITKLTYGMDVSTIRNKIAGSGVTSSNGSTKTVGKVATGDYIYVDNASYQAVIYGDVAGDGSISIKDLLLVQKHLLGNSNLTGANKKAADVSKDGAVTIKDLLLIQKYLLGTGNISQ